ncbi:hypothetical protein BDW66DRAFT_142432 [Aspergillus desertorum]
MPSTVPRRARLLQHGGRSLEKGRQKAITPVTYLRARIFSFFSLFFIFFLPKEKLAFRLFPFFGVCSFSPATVRVGYTK